MQGHENIADKVTDPNQPNIRFIGLRKMVSGVMHTWIIRYEQGNELGVVTKVKQVAHSPRHDFNWDNAGTIAYNLSCRVAAENKAALDYYSYQR